MSSWFLNPCSHFVWLQCSSRQQCCSSGERARRVNGDRKKFVSSCFSCDVHVSRDAVLFALLLLYGTRGGVMTEANEFVHCRSFTIQCLVLGVKYTRLHARFGVRTIDTRRVP